MGIIESIILKSAVDAAESAAAAAKSKKIKVDVEAAQAVLKQLEALAGEVRAQKNTAQQLASSLSSCWQGDSGTEIQTFMTQWISDQEALAARIETKVASVRKSVQAVADADAALARTISGSGRKG